MVHILHWKSLLNGMKIIINVEMEETNMVDLKQLQKETYQNKVDKGFNVTDVNKEFCLTYGEVSEAYEAWRKKFTKTQKENIKLLMVLIQEQKNLMKIQKDNLTDKLQ